MIMLEFYSICQKWIQDLLSLVNSFALNKKGKISFLLRKSPKFRTHFYKVSFINNLSTLARLFSNIWDAMRERHLLLFNLDDPANVFEIPLIIILN